MRYKGGQWTRLSGRYSSLEEAKKELCITDFPCSKCGRLVSAHYCEPTKSDMLSRRVCFKCLFWLEKVDELKNPMVARIGGCHYTVAPENEKGSRGFGGRKSIIKWSDGRQLTTTNLWFQGEIPERFRDELPDNAVFIYT